MIIAKLWKMSLNNTKMGLNVKNYFNSFIRIVALTSL
jgi:hypothetical protein